MTGNTNMIPQCAVFVLVAALLGGASAKPPKRVVGGEDGSIGEFPYQVSIRLKNMHMCGGTIIGKRHILTAGHCVDSQMSKNPTMDMTVVTGTNAVAPGAGNTNHIGAVRIHPDFSNKVEDSWRNDIAIIALTEDIKFDMFTRVAKLPSKNTAAHLDCVASGWGTMGYPRGLHPNNIRKTRMTTLDNDECRERHYAMDIRDSNLCAFASKGVGLCTGDSGGPLVHDGVVHGIASWVTPCGVGQPDVFTRVHFYLDFINSCIEST